MENDSSRAALRVREYGTSGPLVVAIHGGPGTPGGMAQVARTLADQFRVLEPLQRHSDAEPLTVARHVEDLHKVVETLPRVDHPEATAVPRPQGRLPGRPFPPQPGQQLFGYLLQPRSHGNLTSLYGCYEQSNAE